MWRALIKILAAAPFLASLGVALAQEGVLQSLTLINHVPLALPQEVSIIEGSSLPIVLLALDVNEDSLEFSIVEEPGIGNLSGLNSSTGEVTYNSIPGVSGSDFFRFKVSDGAIESETSSVVVTVAPFETAIFMDGFESEDTTKWSSTVP